MAKTRSEIDKLKRDWLSDPCWDIYDTEGFEDHIEELKSFQKECEKKWQQEREIREKAIDEKAKELGLGGLYRLIQENEFLLKRHQEAIIELIEGNNHKAYCILSGNIP